MVQRSHTDLFGLLAGAPDTAPALSDLAGRGATYGELRAALADLDLRLGRPGLRCITLLPDAPSTAILQLALIRTATCIPLNPALTADEIAAIGRQVGADLIVAATGDDRSSQLAADLGTGLERFDATTDGACGAFRLTSEVPADRDPGRDERTDVALILPTSGSTGTPKLVPLTREALLLSAANIADTLRLTPEDCAAHAMPMFHIGAVLDMMLAPLGRGGRVCFAHPMTPDSVKRAVHEGGATWLQLVPAMLIRMLHDCPDEDLEALGASLRFIRSVSADLPPDLHRDAERRFGGLPVIQMYGMTETTGQIASNPLPPAERRPGSVGLVSGPEVALMDPYGNPVPAGSEGEICIRGRTVTPGYENTNGTESFHASWFRSGDLGTLDADGYLTISGRVKELINRGGEKISPLEVDRVAVSHPAISEAASFPVAHATLGEEVGLAVVPASGITVEDTEVRSFLAEHLADYKVPRRIRVVEDLPKLGSGKIDRNALTRRIADESSPADDSRFVPATATQRLLSRLWTRTLEAPPPSPGDDFFDSGGDSLSATGFLVALEQAVGFALPADILYRAPTFGQLAEAVDDLTPTEYRLSLPKSLYDAIRAATAGWPGRRRTSQSLIIEHNGAGCKQPFFWCVAAREVFEDMVPAFGSDRPVHVMRALYGMKEETDDNTARLAAHYADEIDELQPAGPILLGGFCQGADVARLVAEQLRKLGRELKLVVLVDRLFRSRFELPALIVWSRGRWSRTSERAGVVKYVRPERGLPHLFPAGFKVYHVDNEHLDSVRKEAADRLVETLEPFLEAGLPDRPRGADSTDTLEERNRMYSARISASLPRLVRAGSEVSVSASVRNTGSRTWLPTARSGLLLAARWLNLDGHVRAILAGWADLPVAVEPGERVTLKLDVVAPAKRLPYILMLDMVDDGISWFHEAGNRPCKRLVLAAL